MGSRSKVPQQTVAGVLIAARRRCCICYGLARDSGIKWGQIAHLDQDPSNNHPENLAFLCLDHHDEYDARPSQSKGFSIQEVRGYRALLFEFLANATTAPVSVQSRSRRSRSEAKPMRTLAAQLRRDLALRDRMRRDFFKPWAELMKLRPIRHSYEYFAYPKVIIRRIDDKTYPGPDDLPDSKISGWFRVEPYDFYHGGLEVTLGLRRGIIDIANRWDILNHDASFDPSLYTEIRIWHLGRIPWRNIVEYDLKGDQHYSEPHIYCSYRDGGTPYEGFAYSVAGEEYDWPLSLAKRHKLRRGIRPRPEPGPRRQ